MSLSRFLIFGFGALVTLNGCTPFSSNIRLGNTQDTFSLRDVREASQTIRVVPSVPPGASVIGTVEASRCHRSLVEGEPTNEIVTQDLVIAAYARGADGIADIKIEKVSALSRNCWYALDATATAFKDAAK